MLPLKLLRIIAVGLLTWDGIQRSAVVVIGQKCHSFSLGPLRLSNTTQTYSHTKAL